MRRSAALGLLAVVVPLAAGCAGAGRHTTSSSHLTAQSASPTTVHRASRVTMPRWAERCLPKGRQRIGAAPGYVGLTFAAAQRLTDSPVFAGGGGRCSSFDDDVFRTHPIAVVYNTWDVHKRKARIIAAVRGVAGWQPGS